MSELWYYADGNGEIGPVNFEQLNEALAARRNPNDVLVWCARFPNWVTACAFDLLMLNGDDLRRTRYVERKCGIAKASAA